MNVKLKKYQKRSRNSFAKNDYSKAIFYCNKGLKIDPHCKDIYMAKGDAYFFQDNFTKALKCYDEGIMLSKNSLCAFKKNNNERTHVKQFFPILENDEADAALFAKKGRVYIFMCEYSLAMEWYKKALLVCPDEYEYHVALTAILFFQERYEATIQECEKCIQMNSLDEDIYKLMGDAYFYLGKYKKAHECYDIVEDINSNYADVHVSRATVLFETEEYDKAIKNIDTAISLNKKYEWAHYVKANYLYTLEKYEEAIKACNCAFNNSILSPAIYEIKAWALTALKRHWEAAECFEKYEELQAG